MRSNNRVNKRISIIAVLFSLLLTSLSYAVEIKQIEPSIIYKNDVFSLIIGNKGHTEINTGDLTLTTTWVHYFKPDSVEIRSISEGTRIDPGDSLVVPLSDRYIKSCLEDKRIEVTLFDRTTGKFYHAIKSIELSELDFDVRVFDANPETSKIGIRITVTNPTEFPVEHSVQGQYNLNGVSTDEVYTRTFYPYRYQLGKKSTSAILIEPGGQVKYTVYVHILPLDRSKSNITKNNDSIDIRLIFYRGEGICGVNSVMYVYNEVVDFADDASSRPKIRRGREEEATNSP